MRARVLPPSTTESETPESAWRSLAAAPARPPAPRGSASAPPSPEAQLQQQVRLAFESGVREGEAAARQQLEVQLRQMTDQLAHTVADVAACRGDAIRRAEADIVQLSMEIARRVIHRELSMDSSVLGALIRAALEKLASQEVHRVRVHPDQAQAVRRCLEEMGRSTDIEVAGDPTLPPGGAIFESSRGSLDASVETQLQEIERGLVDQLQKRS